MKDLKERLKKAKYASMGLASLSLEKRNQVLNNLAIQITSSMDKIIQANQKDLKAAQENNLSSALLDRLLLNKSRIEGMVKMVEEVSQSPEYVGVLNKTLQRPDGLEVYEETIPLGMIGMIFESRPNVMIDLAALCLKTCNGFVAKGGKEALHSNQVLFDLFIASCEGLVDTDAFVLLDSTDRASVGEMLKIHQYIDLIIPRGGEGLVSFVRQNSTIPVIAHEKGLCHLYFDQELDQEIALNVLKNGKVSRPGVCNAIETLVLHEAHLKNSFIQQIFNLLQENKVEVFAEENVYQEYNQDFSNLKLAEDDQFEQEYLDLKISVKIVSSVKEAILFIQEHSSKHTEVIISYSEENQDLFRRNLDSSCIAVNASSRFNDGGELGLGSELGISTSKLHAYGPMGLKHLVTRRFFLQGRGQVRI